MYAQFLKVTGLVLSTLLPINLEMPPRHFCGVRMTLNAPGSQKKRIFIQAFGAAW
jgi:hypothetical protein